MKRVCLVLLLVLAVAVTAEARTCTPKDAEAADAAVDHLDTWADVYDDFRRYGHCDDGSIAEGNSEGVARLLVDSWQTLPQLADLVKRHPSFRDYVLRHIDTTLDTGDLDRIADLATTACPESSKALCASLKAAATKAAGQ